MKVLVVEDEPAIAAAVKQGLQEAGMNVELTGDGIRALEMGLNGAYGLIVLDIMLPGLDGMQVCQKLREAKVTTPILMMTARDSLDDKVKGLDLGADDYLPKPFEFPELIARARALTRRDRLHKSRVIRVHDLEIDTGAHRVKRAEQEITLTAREYALLELLAANEGKVLTRDVIQERVWEGFELYSNTVDAFIKMLRKKVDAPFDIKLIQTVHGTGYTMRSPIRDS
ncbi:MAG: DNA-binding response regulator [Armatimonadetes bacterium 55-13]|nr:response regulator transcription factor [Armatimonadota bacterium]ODU53183.1 MAG: DNA-binding response regulator [bacterium SCN 57-13]OJU61884.1 MAG: DNA-binding response regulator [Armatimonadetes bacterium 55-13]